MNITGLSLKSKKVAGSPMGFRDRRARVRRVGATAEHFGARDVEVLAAVYPSPLSFYDSVPGCDLSLADFEALAVERLKLLRIMEKHSQVWSVICGFPSKAVWYPTLVVCIIIQLDQLYYCQQQGHHFPDGPLSTWPSWK